MLLMKYMMNAVFIHCTITILSIRDVCPPPHAPTTKHAIDASPCTSVCGGANGRVQAIRGGAGGVNTSGAKSQAVFIGAANLSLVRLTQFYCGNFQTNLLKHRKNDVCIDNPASLRVVLYRTGNRTNVRQVRRGELLR